MLPILDLKRSWNDIREEVLSKIEEVMDAQDFILGREERDFESDVESYFEGGHAVGCASGTDALMLALMALDIKAGDEVITTPYTFFATASCITRLGATPVFADICPDTYNIDLDDVLSKITPRTKVFLPVHLFGQMVPLERIMPELNKRGIKVIEDTAQSFGAWRMINGKIVRAGTVGDIGAFSFFPTKNLGGAGDGGMVFTKDEAIASRLKRLRVHGAGTTYIHDEVGLNSRLDTLQAAVLRVKLRNFEKWNEERRKIAAQYKMMFASNDLLKYVTPPCEFDGNHHIYHQYVVRIAGSNDERDKLCQFMHDEGIGVRIYYPLSLHLQQCFAYLGGKTGDCPISEKLCEQSLALPVFPGLTAEEQTFVVETIKKYFTQNA